MSDDQRVYSDEEFALILRNPAELGAERNWLPASAAASPLERLIGGTLRHAHEARFPITLDENRAARLCLPFVSAWASPAAGMPGTPAWFGFEASIAGMGGTLAVVRGYWASSTRKVRERITVTRTPSARPLLRPPGLVRSGMALQLATTASNDTLTELNASGCTQCSSNANGTTDRLSTGGQLSHIF